MLSVNAELILLNHDWPGNLRELRNVCREIALALDGEELVRVEHLPDYLRVRRTHDPDVLARSALRRRVESVLVETRGNKSEAARRLGLPRTTLNRLLRMIHRRPAHSLSVGA